MFAERLRRATLYVAALSCVGVAEQHIHPADLLRGLPWTDVPSDHVNVWVLMYAAAAAVLLVAAVRWPRSPGLTRFAAVTFAAALVARGAALLFTYGFDLWGTVVRAGVLLPMLVVASWSWSGSAIRELDDGR